MASLLHIGLLTVLLGLIVLSLLLLRALTPNPPPSRSPTKPHLLILLGSGGHTAEMLSLLRGIPSLTTLFPRRTYVYSTGDWLSAKKAQIFEEQELGSGGNKGGEGVRVEMREVPRSRLVGQGWGSVPLSAGRCLVRMIRVLWEAEPDLVLMNGPGNAVMCTVGAVGLRVVGRRARLVYVESFARIEGLSLSGRLVYPVVDRFLVQWERLREKYPRAEYRGVLV